MTQHPRGAQTGSPGPAGGTGCQEDGVVWRGDEHGFPSHIWWMGFIWQVSLLAL